MLRYKSRKVIVLNEFSEKYTDYFLLKPLHLDISRSNIAGQRITLSHDLPHYSPDDLQIKLGNCPVYGTGNTMPEALGMFECCLIEFYENLLRQRSKASEIGERMPFNSVAFLAYLDSIIHTQ